MKILTASGRTRYIFIPRQVRRLGVSFTVFAFVTGLAGYILLMVSPVPTTAPPPVDLQVLRQMAASAGGALPVALNAGVIAEGSMPGMLVLAGADCSPRRMITSAYQVVYEDGTMMVDAGYTRADHASMFPAGPFDEEQFKQLQAALRASRAILLTHTHADHLGGIVHSAYVDELATKVYLTSAQAASAESSGELTADLAARFQPIQYEGYLAFAPGLVLIAAAGHTSGDQMVYVKLQNGAEYLLTGDVAWSAESFSRQNGRPLLTCLMGGEDWLAAQNQVRRVADLAQHAPTLHLVVSHDGAQLDGLMKAGWVGPLQ